MNQSKYDDIINLPHHKSQKHPHMSQYNRAAQFSPFAALTGHGEAIAEVARVTEKMHDIDNDLKEEISNKLTILSLPENENTEVSLKFYVEDGKKDGGEYETVTSIVSHLNENSGEITISDGRTIPISHILSIDGKIFEEYGY